MVFVNTNQLLFLYLQLQAASRVQTCVTRPSPLVGGVCGPRLLVLHPSTGTCYWHSSFSPEFDSPPPPSVHTSVSQEERVYQLDCISQPSRVYSPGHQSVSPGATRNLAMGSYWNFNRMSFRKSPSKSPNCKDIVNSESRYNCPVCARSDSRNFKTFHSHFDNV